MCTSCIIIYSHHFPVDLIPQLCPMLHVTYQQKRTALSYHPSMPVWTLMTSSATLMSQWRVTTDTCLMIISISYGTLAWNDSLSPCQGQGCFYIFFVKCHLIRGIGSSLFGDIFLTSTTSEFHNTRTVTRNNRTSIIFYTTAS